jgi:hypothetical protein
MTRKRLLAIPLVAGLLFGAAPGLFSSPAPGTDLESISFEKEGPAVAFVMRVRGEFGNEAFTLREPERLVIDLSPVDGILAPPLIEVNAGGVLRVRTGRFQASVARLVFDLDGPSVLYRIDRTADGLKVAFWKKSEGAPRAAEKVPAAEAPATPAKVEPKRPAETLPAPVAAPVAKPAEPPATGTPVPAPGERGKGFFVHLGAGVGTFLSSESVFTRTFAVNEAQGTAESTYKPKLNTPAVLTFGRYVRLQDMSVKLGLDIEYWNFKNDGTHVFSIPNPVAVDAVRTLSQTSSFRSYFTAVSAFGLFRVFTNEALTVLAGPELGYVFGKYKFLDVIDIEDRAPYTEAEASIREVTFADKTTSSLLAGVRAAFEYALSAKLAIVLDIKVQYVSPEISELSNKLGLSQAGVVVGIQYNF